MNSVYLEKYYTDVEPNHVIKPYMIEPVVHKNSDGPNRIPIPLITSLKPHEAKANKNIIVGNQ